MEAAPKEEDNRLLLEDVKCGTKLEFYWWPTSSWTKGVVVKEFHNSLYAITSELDDPVTGPQVCHLTHSWFRCEEPNTAKRRWETLNLEQVDESEPKRRRATQIMFDRRDESEVGKDPCLVSYCDNNKG